MIRRDASDGSPSWPWYRKAQAERGARGWSYAELARRIGEDEENTRRWLLGKATPRDGIVAKIAEAIGWPYALLTDTTVGYVFDVERKHNTSWLKATLRELDDNGRKVVAALSDPSAAEYLATMLEQYKALRQKMREPPRIPRKHA